MQFDLHIARIKKFGRIVASPSLLWVFLRYGVFAGVEHRAVIQSNLRFIVDIGANKGQFALACRQWAPHAEIVSFEPLPSPCQTYKLIFAGSKNIKLFEVAVGPKNESCIIHLSAREDSSSLLSIGRNQEKKFPGTHEVGSTMIEIAPLNKFLSVEDIPSVAMLKLDVQGYEMKALEGCESLLGKFEYVYCECSFIELYSGQSLASEIITWLHNRLFKLVGIYNLNYDNEGTCIQGDFLFQKFVIN